MCVSMQYEKLQCMGTFFIITIVKKTELGNVYRGRKTAPSSKEIKRGFPLNTDISIFLFQSWVFPRISLQLVLTQLATLGVPLTD